MQGIDIHTHAFHPKIAHKVVARLESHYGIPVVGSGLATDLLARLKRAGIAGAAVLNAATEAAQVAPANSFIISLTREHPELIGFGTLHPDLAAWEDELERLRRNAIHGVKLHAEFQGFWLDDPRLEPFFEAGTKDFVFMLHVGDTAPPSRNPSCPFKVRRLHDMFPRARIIAAHLGGYLHWQWALETIIGSDVYIDTSSSLPYIDDATLTAILRRHPRERVLFGSDYPIHDPGESFMEFQTRARFSDREMEELLANGSRLLAEAAEHRESARGRALGGQ